MKRMDCCTKVGKPVKNNAIASIGTYCGHGEAKPIKNAVGTQPKAAGYKKIKGTVSG